jgi:hypothetical protein
MILQTLLVNTALVQMYDTEYDFSITVDDVDLYESADVYAQLRQFATFSFIDANATITAFVSRWEMWRAQQGPDLKRAWDALHALYNPISNYDMQETSTDGTARDKDTETTTPDGEQIVDTKNNRYGFNADNTGDGVPVTASKSTQSYNDYSVTTEHEHENTLTDTDLQGSYNDIKNHVMQRSGNIGVTTSQQMISAELELRQQDLLYQFCKRFINKWCSLLGGGDTEVITDD